MIVLIRNVVFDIGNVLATFDPAPLIRETVGEDADTSKYRKMCFSSDAFRAFERGECDLDAVLRSAERDLGAEAGAVTQIIRRSNELLHETENTDAVRRLKEHGYGTYYLSNTNTYAWEYMRGRFSFFDYMDGGIASFLVGMEKPGTEIFRAFLDRFALRAEECLFVDDREENTAAAAGVGMRVLTLAHMEDLGECLCRILGISLY